MADNREQEVARDILNVRQAQAVGDLDLETAAQILAEKGIDPAEAAVGDSMMQAPPASLQASPIEASDVAPVEIPMLSPEMVSAAQQAEQNQNSLMALQTPQPPGTLTLGQGLDTLALSPKAYNAKYPNGPGSQPIQEQVVEEVPEPVAEAPPAPPVPPPVQDVNEHPIVKGAQEAIAENRATIQAQKDLQAEFKKQQDEYDAQQKAIQGEIEGRDESVRARSLPEIMQRGSFGEKLTAAIALGLGGLSQGLTGAKTNPVLDFIDKQVEQQAQRDKMSLEAKLSLKKQLMDLAQMKMQNVANQSTDLYHKQALQNQMAELDVKKQEVEGNQKIKAQELFDKQNAARIAAYAESGGTLTTTAGLTEEQRKRVVRLPDGTHKLATVAPDQVDASAKRRVPLETAISSIKRIQVLAQDLNRVTDLTKRAQIAAEVKMLAGALREPVVGPGAMTEDEYKRIIDTVGDPTKLFALPSLQSARLGQVYKKMDSDLTSEYKRIGIDLPKTAEEQLRESYTNTKK